MNVVVYDIAAFDGGGAAVLRQYIERARKDLQNQWWFIVSLPELTSYDSENVHVLYQSSLNRTGIQRWINRFWFEHFILNRIVSRIKPDRVLSLQNMPMPKAKCHQTVYLHQSLQFSPVKFSFLKKDERACAIRQRIICSLIKRHLPKADEVIVQTKWMKAATAQWAGISEERICIETPSGCACEPDGIEVPARNRRRFFYPAGGYVYKNHRAIIEACKILKQKGIDSYSVTFTLNPSDNLYVKTLYDDVMKSQLPISFVGYQNQATVFSKYAEQILLFPSYIETFGLPLQEAMVYSAPIIASDCPYAHDVLDVYGECCFVKWNDVQAWADAMEKCMNT